MTMPQFIYPVFFLMDIHYFNSAAANILIINNFGKCASYLVYTISSETTNFGVLCTFNFLINHQIALQCGFTNLHSHQTCTV